MPFPPLYVTQIDVRRTKCICSGSPVCRILSAGPALIMLDSTMVKLRGPAGTHAGAGGRESQMRSGLTISACGGPSIQVTHGAAPIGNRLWVSFCLESRCDYGSLSVSAVLRTCLVPTRGPTMNGSDLAEPVF